jgi:hypothetical protein
MNKKIMMSALAAILALSFSTSCSYFPMKKEVKETSSQVSESAPECKEECTKKKCKSKECKGKKCKKSEVKKADVKTEAKK